MWRSPEKFEYRDLGIAAATGGRFHSHVIRSGGTGQQTVATSARRALRLAIESINRPASTMLCSPIRTILNSWK